MSGGQCYKYLPFSLQQGALYSDVEICCLCRLCMMGQYYMLCWQLMALYCRHYQLLCIYMITSFFISLEPNCVLFRITKKSGVIASPLLLWDFSYMTVLLRCVFVFFSLMENGWAITSVSVGNVVGRWSLLHY